MTKTSIFGKIHQSLNNLIDSALIEESEPSTSPNDSKIRGRNLAREIQNLEIYLDTLVTALSEGRLPVNIKKVTQIFDESIAFDRLSIDIPVDNFINLYNELPNILIGYAIDATLSDESYRQTDNSLITFHRLNRGTYWIFPADRVGKVGTAWLVPNPFKNINVNKNKSLKFSFDLNLASDKGGDIILLEKPALVQILPDSDRLIWKLTERGQIRAASTTATAIGSNSRSIDSTEIVTLKTEIEKLKSEQKNYQSQQTKINTGLIDSIKKIVAQELAKTAPELPQSILPSGLPKPIPKSSINKPIVTDSLLSFAGLYNTSEKDFLKSYMVSTATLVKNNGSHIELIEDNVGNYWIVPFNSTAHYLVPKMNFPNYDKCLEILALLFDGVTDSTNFILFKPAIVSLTKTNMPKKWKLEQKGYLE